MLLARKSQRIRSINRGNVDRNKRRYEGGRNPREKACVGPVRANLGKERRRRNTFRVGHTETPQMPSFHNRLLPSAPFLSPSRISSSIFTEDYACLLPPLHITPPLLHLSCSFSHPPALRGVFSSPFRPFLSFGPLTLLHSPRFRFRL
jgi:hypothetical protein